MPANGGTYVVNQALASSFSCTEGAGGPGISSCTDQDGRPSGAPIDTSTPGTYSFTVTARSADGLSSSSSVTYTVAPPGPPRIWLPLPTNRAVYAQGQPVNSFYLCADGTGGPGLTSCADQNGQGSGAAIDTSTLGSHTFTVTATSTDGQTASTTNTYRVIPAPAVAHVVAHRGGAVTLQVTLYGPGTVDVLSTAASRASRGRPTWSSRQAAASCSEACISSPTIRRRSRCGSRRVRQASYCCATTPAPRSSWWCCTRARAANLTWSSPWFSGSAGSSRIARRLTAPLADPGGVHPIPWPTPMAPRVILLPGDGIGPEIIGPAVEVLGAAGAEFEYEQHLFGGASIDAHGTALTDETLEACRRADAVLLAAVGGPKWDTTDPSKPRPEQGLLGLRKGLGLFANLRPGAAAAGAV